ncbi:MAG: ABC transporter ATP-binding protein [Alphaproteobacteria bacterium]|nr:ABC transporter ATP-binding protein [Alphaproteobacteria bacterium]
MDIEVNGVAKRYGTTLAVSDVSFGVEQGHVLSLLGPSGCGKTTVMRMIAGLIQPTAGSIAIKGKPVNQIPVHKRNVGMLFQNYALFPHLTVARNIAFGLEMRGLSRSEAVARVEKALAMVRLEGFGDRFPHQLSGGQQQRVALARALVIEPAVLLLDEPFGALDKKLRENMQIEMRQLQQRLGITTLMVTHDQDEALTLSDRIAVMRAGRIEQFGTPTEIYERPVSRFVASFIGTSNFFRGRVTGRHAGGFVVESQDGVKLGLNGAPPRDLDVTVALRPEGIQLSAPKGDAAPLNGMRAIIDQIVYRGLNTHYHLRRADAEPLIVIRQNETGADAVAGLEPGASVIASWAADRNLVVQDDA